MPEEPFKKKASPFISSRTMREDILSLSRQERSLADLIKREPPHMLLGQKEQLAREFVSAWRWRVAMIAGAIAAVLIGAGTLWFFLFYSPTPSEEKATPFFLPFPAVHEEEIRFRLNDREGLSTLLNQKKQRVTDDQQPAFFSLRIFSLDITKTESRPASTFEVFQTLRLRPPPALLQTFGTEMYLYILADTFSFIIPINKPEKALEGLLAWEPSMARDFASLARAGTPSQLFEDRIITNSDARISSSIGYAFFGGRYAVIALSEDALRASLEQLAKR